MKVPIYITRNFLKAHFANMSFFSSFRRVAALSSIRCFSKASKPNPNPEIKYTKVKKALRL